MNGPAISLRGLTKDYAPVRALNGVDLEVESGEIFGFLGPNGAGKSTTIRVLLDLLRPTTGQAEILGIPSHQATPELRARVGYLPGELSLPPQQASRQLPALPRSPARWGRGGPDPRACRTLLAQPHQVRPQPVQGQHPARPAAR